MLVKDSKCENIFMDEGMEECSMTSAAQMVEFLTPEPEVVEAEEFELSEEQIQMVGGTLAVVVLAWMASSMNFTSPDPAAVQASQSVVVPAVKSTISQPEFGLLKEFMVQ